jgi:hypothetical protein
VYLNGRQDRFNELLSRFQQSVGVSVAKCGIKPSMSDGYCQKVIYFYRIFKPLNAVGSSGKHGKKELNTNEKGQLGGRPISVTDSRISTTGS